MLRHSLPALVNDLRETSGLKSIAAATLDSIMEGVPASRAALVIGDRLIDGREVTAGEAEAWLSGWSPPAPHERHSLRELSAVEILRPWLQHPRIALSFSRGWVMIETAYQALGERKAVEAIAKEIAEAART